MSCFCDFVNLGNHEYIGEVLTNFPLEVGELKTSFTIYECELDSKKMMIKVEKSISVKVSEVSRPNWKNGEDELF